MMMINNALHCAMLEEELKLTVYSKCKGMLTDGVVLHCDKAQPRMVAATIETIQKLKFKILPHSA
jgi:hypothetical protein